MLLIKLSYFVDEFASFKHTFQTIESLNCWLNMKNSCLRKRIKNRENVMQKPMDFYVCGINRSSESILMSYLFFA